MEINTPRQLHEILPIMDKVLNLFQCGTKFIVDISSCGVVIERYKNGYIVYTYIGEQRYLLSYDRSTPRCYWWQDNPDGIIYNEEHYHHAAAYFSDAFWTYRCLLEVEYRPEAPSEPVKAKWPGFD